MTALTFLAALVSISAALCAVMTVAWLIQQRTGNSGWVDTVWTFGLGAVGLAAALIPASPDAWSGARQMLAATLIVAWSLRLGTHIAHRTSGIVDDPRYAELIRGWGEDAPRQMFWLLQKQAWVTIPLAFVIFLAAHNPAPGIRQQDALAVLILLVGIGGEAMADHQLRRFRADPANKGKVIDTGLWRFSRHPNYFFEWLGWCAWPLLAIDLGGGYPAGYLALAAPACMYWLLVHVSGIPPLEKHMLETRGAAFRAYQARTSAFFPLPPGKRTERTP